jgi:hypothetical protein
MMHHRQMWAMLEANINTTITPLPTPYQTQPSSNFSAIPYFHDPLTNTTMWHFQHGKSHKDLNQTFAGAWPWGQPITSSMNPVVPITDNDLQKPLQNMFWTFANYREHLSASQVSAPAGLQSNPFLIP